MPQQTRALTTLLTATLTEIDRRGRHILAIRRAHNVEIAHLHAELADLRTRVGDPDDGLNRADTACCGPCIDADAPCRYHSGVEDGVTLLADLVRALADDPDLAEHVRELAADSIGDSAGNGSTA